MQGFNTTRNPKQMILFVRHISFKQDKFLSNRINSYFLQGDRNFFCSQVEAHAGAAYKFIHFGARYG